MNSVAAIVSRARNIRLVGDMCFRTLSAADVTEIFLGEIEVRAAGSDWQVLGTEPETGDRWAFTLYIDGDALVIHSGGPI